ncbi:SUKH-4 family immunity protein [Streptomyces guryensis]|uniref:SUKH-4 family immunity protein n=1 Tax=Streptomyces guryensis TaxID=2886947 RepID=A0A9Q3ZAE9_9ACTN|nr:SUKH-4 family immunity protein [Streptomyces guryensis]MCD9880783.1 SUKH-4 family immunity protein [Streptomyces guryensis]
MNRPPALTRAMLETVFDPAELIVAPAESLSAVADPDSREVLGTLGIPVWDNPWFDMEEGIAERLGRVEEWDEKLEDRYSVVPPGAGKWIGLGMVPYDGIAFDPDTGKVYCLPDDSEIYLWNSSLRSFVHFLYLLQLERPHFDAEWESEIEVPYDPQAAQIRVRSAMMSVDPVALENPESGWHGILTYIVDPEHHFL